ncbi:tetratricopeptide repeat protein [Aestuariirhabdus sp. Z084]|uniref:tetratricopeptide repeat protein n=1 Tax=Aestuariirhabdus haliotis TaxID=2918751 RepID=UPI00201B45E7|nr:tetratricopeptide repeat protein [Aestuariirhabdus haliotis]MCL6414695.1 tetratricopeptide repeat protein [Aestuariirhabdus haliotis]MCL6418627.1 tetratricopeptide repeat protein [Aestuariirhabdus haliotis]
MEGSRVCYFLLGLFFVMESNSAFANRVQDDEMAFLPPYCWARMRPKSEAEITQWRNIIGPDFMHVHHFCTAKAFIRRSLDPRKTVSAKREDLQVAKNNLEYVFSHLENQGYILLPEINMVMGKVYDRLEEPVLAVRFYQKAIDMNPNFTQGYAAFSEFYRRQGNMEKARGLLMQGIDKNPDSIILKRRIERLASEK